MKIVITSTPAAGHVNPLLGIAHILIGEGHDVTMLSGTAMRDRIERSGAQFWPLPSAVDFDLRDVDAAFPERSLIPPGPAMLRFDLERVFIDPIPGQYQALKALLEEFPADIIISDSLFLGVLPLLLGPRSRRPAIALCGTTFLLWHRDDGAPRCLGLPPAATDSERLHYASLDGDMHMAAIGPAEGHLNRCLVAMGSAPLTTRLFDALTEIPDAYLELTVPSFEFPRRDLPSSVEFVGTPPIIPNQAAIPPWASDLSGPGKVVLVTQGTVANDDFGRLVEPAIIALAEEPDVLVIVTCGGRAADCIAYPLPRNVRLASYLPFEWLLPRIDAMVTNGGFGSVNQALSFGVPLVTAGLTEDKADVNVRVAWRGVGINLASNTPTPRDIRTAVRAVLDEPAYRTQAHLMAREYAAIGTPDKVTALVDRLVNAQRRTRTLAAAN